MSVEDRIEENPAVSTVERTQPVETVPTPVHEQPTESQAWIPGTYVLLNARSGTALDLSGADQRSLIGFPAHMGQNQQWEFIPSGSGYTIRSACASSCELYLSVESVRDNAPIIASPFPSCWDVQFDEKHGSALRSVYMQMRLYASRSYTSCFLVFIGQTRTSSWIWQIGEARLQVQRSA
ncbi:carbohydrate-binding module family 13 protein [Postia placenta MAD-698-R-SB12]|uniref:Carbohydrate-binding module family 13 protein n=1 Tax=Postia placenta MAD-698-R-SB12 TaxID=670580 RepID=A0A1X6N2E0_9APHY|nr:carbohydrate-binding module family 13 protein [Postia placenta MAD-698-R-SB12]OSX62764.1 carbohydrate-binding module family 13 protein [Postia placenta MAD-698-R-SB12]